MLKFSGFVGLTSCLGEARKKAHLKEGHLRPKEQKDRTTKGTWQFAPSREKRTQCAAFAKGALMKEQHLDTQACSVIPPQWLQGRLLAEGNVDSEADMLSGISRKRNAHSRYYWFTEFCNSQCSSHFAAPFISIRAKTSIAESCKLLINRKDN